jgi:FlaA1/EpsC-like NDP-sugar epimerase
MVAALTRFRKHLIVLIEATITVVSIATAFLLRFDFSVPAAMNAILVQGVLLAVLVKVPIFFAARLHTASWRFAGIRDLSRVFAANSAASAALMASVLVWHSASGFPRSLPAIDFLVCFLLTGGAQFAVRTYHEIRSATTSRRDGKPVLIYGAGAAGRMLLREIQSNPSLGYDVVGFIDDARSLRGAMIMNAPVLGGGRQVASTVDRYRARGTNIEEIIVAMPSASGRQTREAIANCRSAGVACKAIPRFGELLAGKVLSSQIRNVNVLDLLGREPVRLDEDRIHESVAGRSLLITGAAGSIGAELSRQTARFGPRKLVLFDQAESPLYNIDLELRAQFPALEIVAELGDVRDAMRVEDLIRRHQVDSIFHAAAYKHVPMMEAHLLEGVKTNVFGTWNLVRAAYRNRVSNFVMISTDKAVNPSSVMGMSKRIAELIVHARSSNGNASATRFASVRFGNVLGSNGSVVPLFQSQIAAGGPVTVTHPEMRRYFMSVPEAVGLVLQASTMSKDSEIFVLDMGEPVRIMDLAINLIGLAGLVPHEDIEIRISGLRPGEKLFEELRIEGEHISPTYHEKIKIFSGARLTRQQLEAWLTRLTALVEARDADAALDHLRALVPEYQPHPAAAEQEHPAAAEMYAARVAEAPARLRERWQPSQSRRTVVHPVST